MRLVQSHSDFRVYDDVLPAAKFRQVWRYVQAQEFVFVQREHWFKIWRLGDGAPLWGPEILTAAAPRPGLPRGAATVASPIATEFFPHAAPSTT
jgi:hypothetical protein